MIMRTSARDYVCSTVLVFFFHLVVWLPCATQIMGGEGLR